MTVGIIILVAFLAFYIVALYCILVASSTSDENMRAIWNNVPEEDESEKENNHFRIDAWITVLSIVLFSAGIVVGVMISTGSASSEKTPETEVVINTTECTSAPVIESLEPTDDIYETTYPSVPETEDLYTEETIHIEETEPESESTEPDEQPTGSTSPEVPSAPVTDETPAEVDPDEVEMLACVIYQESGGDDSCDNCRRYVADIVLNRVNDERFPDTIHGVLTQEGQYGRLHWTGIKWPERAKYDVEKDAVARAYRIAEEVLSGKHSALYGQGYIWQAGFEQGTDGFWCCGHYYGR